ncbi:MAG: SRPBCC family protein [Actinomycetota bacterium]|nr:SRPBCC family protein [Actinomycetota bacterium]
MSTNTNNGTEMFADSRVPTVEIIREFDARVERVFRAHTEAELITQWLGPRSVSMRVERYDAHTGGAYRYVLDAEDGTAHGFYGAFHEVRPTERIVQTFTYEGYPDGVSLETMTFEDLGNRRTRLRSVSMVDSFEARDMMLASGMETGVVQGYEKLDELLGMLS